MKSYTNIANLKLVILACNCQIEEMVYLMIQKSFFIIDIDAFSIYFC